LTFFSEILKSFNQKEAKFSLCLGELNNYGESQSLNKFLS